jgi:uncharacterized protein DUF5667
MMKPIREEEVFASLLEGMEQDAPRELARIAALAKALEHVRPVTGPAPVAFRNALRNRILVEAATRKPWLDRVRERWVERNERARRSFKFVFANAVAAALLLAGGSIMAVAEKAVPGDWDYWAKRAHENARLLITRAPQQRAFLQMDLARERLDEIRELINRREPSAKPFFVALNDMDARTLDATALLLQVYGDTQNRLPLDELTSFAVAQKSALEVLVDRMPPGARPPARDSIDILQRVTDRITGIVGGCLCPANALLPKADTGGGSETPDNSASGGQTPVCACAQFRGDDKGGDNPVAQPPPTPPPSTPPTTPPTPDPDHPIDLPSLPIVDDNVDDVVNDLIDQVIQPLLPTPLPTITVPAPPLKLGL